MIGGALDLLGVDARAARARDAVERDVAQLATAEGREAARHRDPFASDAVREVAGQSTFRALRELAPSAPDVPHRDALLRWVHELLQARIGRELVLDEADAAHALDPELGPRTREKMERRDQNAPRVLASFEEARTALVSASTIAVADAAFGRLGDLAAPVAAARRELRARRFEAARRLGLDHPWALATVASAGDVAALARSLLDATEPLARELDARLRRRAEPGGGAAVHAIDDGFGRDAPEGWPARLTVRWLEEAFGAIARRPPRVASAPPALAGASFLRAAAGWGAALRVSSIARSLPFALARDPYPTEAFLVGDALALAVAGAPFAKRKLGLSARSADAHARALFRVVFRALRMQAAELLAEMPESARTDELEELSARVFGAPLPSDLAIAWACGGFSGRRRIDAPARLLAGVRAHAFARDLVDRYDEDWFDNPRAGTHLASMGAGPIWNGELPAEGAPLALAKAFEEILG